MTFGKGLRSAEDTVSIHATLAGGDGLYVLVPSPTFRFYPRHPRGWRQAPQGLMRPFRPVSIHATLAGGDMRAFCVALPFLSFYPRHPRGWRH